MGKEAHDLLKATPVPDLIAANRKKELPAATKLETIHVE
jgi:hypothetical protein